MRRLREAAAEGRLTFDELTDRLPVAMESVTREQLYRVLGDLVSSGELASVVAEEPHLTEGPGWSWDTPLVTHAGMKKIFLVGDYEIPPFLEIVSRGGKVVMNAMAARPLAPVIDIVLSGIVPFVLVVPEGWGVDISELQANSLAGGAAFSTVQSRAVPGMPRVVLRGQSNQVIRVRNPLPRDERLLRKWREGRFR